MIIIEVGLFGRCWMVCSIRIKVYFVTIY